MAAQGSRHRSVMLRPFMPIAAMKQSLAPAFQNLACTFAVTLALVACSNGGQRTAPVEQARLLVTAATTVLSPETSTPRPAVDLSPLGSWNVAGHYRVTTPAGEPFAFDLVSWSRSASGGVQVSVAHAKDGDQPPTTGTTSLAAAGFVPTGTGLIQGSEWLGANGSGFARLTMTGKIDRDQVLAVTSDLQTITLVEVAIGPRSAINQAATVLTAHPGIVSEATIYSSDAWAFGLPAIAVSGDRTSIVAYEGNRVEGMSHDRYEMRLQHDKATGQVTGGGTAEHELDSGHWRDHEIAALYNVLAVARSEYSGARVRFSFDRGATFAQEVELDAMLGQSRLVQVAMAADYTLAVAHWVSLDDGSRLELRLAEARPVAFDLQGSPTWFQFGAAQVVATAPVDSVPLTTGIAWSDGGDLVIGHGVSVLEPGPMWTSTTHFRCAVRLYGGELRDRPVDQEVLIGRDPSVAVLGQGPALRIFYAYETTTGVRLATSDDAGATFTLGAAFGGPGDHQPAVFARELAGNTRVDVLYLAQGTDGTELHHTRWLDWSSPLREDYRLSTATMVHTPPQAGRNTSRGFTGPYDYGWRTTQISWLGYDAVQDGDELVVVFDEVTFDGAFICLGTMTAMPSGGLSSPMTTSNPFIRANPPPLAPGMTLPVPAIDTAHAHQLRLVRID